MKRILAIVTVAVIAGVVIAVMGQRVHAGEEPTAPAGQDAPKPAAVATEEQKADNGMAAMKKAADAKKYLFVFFYAKENEQADAFKKSFESAAAKLGDKALWATVDKALTSENEIVEKFGLKNAPASLVLAIAPNGAVTGNYQGESSEQRLLDMMVSPCLQGCLKGLQQGKIVFLCAQNRKTKLNDAAMQGVNEFLADARFAKVTEVVGVDPSDAGEVKLMTQLNIDPKGDQAITILLAPPGGVVAKVAGPTSKDAFIAAMQKATSGACGAGGCGPKGCAPPTPAK